MADVYKFAFPVVSFEPYDGDTIAVMLDQGFNTFQKTHIRVLGVDTPELKNATQKPAAMVARDLTVAWLKDRLDLMVVSWEADKYGDRWLGDFFPLSKPDDKLSLYLLSKGLAKPYDGTAKKPWTKKELDAILALKTPAAPGP